MGTVAREDPLVRLATLALVLAACLPMSRLFNGGALIPIAAAALASVVTTAAIRRRGLSPFPDLFMTVVVLSVIVLIFFLPDSLAFGIFPTFETWSELTGLLSQGAQRIVLEVAPVDTGPELLMFVVVGVWLTAWLIESSAVTIGNPMLAVLSGLPVLITPGTLVSSDQIWLDAGWFVAASMFLLWAKEREEIPATLTGRRLRGGPAAAVALTGVAVMVAGIPLLPGFGEPSRLRSLGDGGISFNPVTALRPTLSDTRERDLFTVLADRPGYYKLTSLDKFDGEMFEPSSDSLRGRTKAVGRLKVARESSVRTLPVSQKFTLLNLAGNWLPAQSQAVEMTGLRDPTLFEPDSGALVLVDGVPRSAQYSVSSEVPDPVATELDVAEVAEGLPSRFLEVPRASAELRAISASITQGAATPYRKAVAIQEHLQGFTYDLRVAATHDLKTMEQFLTVVRRGYCEQFATTMAVLARLEGIPSRVAIGFGPGRSTGRKVGGATESLVTTLDAHAWPELWIAGAGWLRFEPTPRAGFGFAPDYSQPPEPVSVDPVAPAPSLPTNEPSARPTPVVPPKDAVTDEQQPTSGRFLGWLVALMLLTVTGGVLVAVWRMRSENLNPYSRFLAFCTAAGVGRLPGETPSEHARRLKSADDLRPGAVDALVAQAESWAYGQQDLAVKKETCDEAMKAVGESLGKVRKASAVAYANFAGGVRR